MVRKLAEGLLEVQGDVVCFIEDDEWYHPDYLAKMVEFYEETSCPRIGIRPAIYYHVPRRIYRIHPNVDRASLSQTLLSREWFPRFTKICSTSSRPFVDRILWQSRSRQPRPDKAIFDQDLQAPWVISLKGCPGRSGIGVGHRMKQGTPDRGELRKWVGDEDFETILSWSR